MHPHHSNARTDPGAKRPHAVIGALLALVAMTACGSDLDDGAATPATSDASRLAAQPDTTSPDPSVPEVTASATTPDTTTPTTTAGQIEGLPEAPLVLYEWYPADGDTKTIVVSDAELTAPPVRIVPAQDGAAIHSNWSPDGMKLTWEVLAGDTASVWTANADGSEPTEVATCLAEPCVQMAWPSFASNGQQLLVTRYDLNDQGDWGPSHLVLVDLTNGNQTIIASTQDGTTAFYMSTMSPDGSQVAATLETYTDATQNTRTKSEVVVIDTDPATTEAPVPITDPALYGGYPRWHPSEDRILFASFDLDAYQGDEESQLYTIASDGSSLTQLTRVDYTTTQRRPGEASWTPDGQRIIASIGVVEGGSVVDVKIAYIDPSTGEIDETSASGAMPTLQP